MGRKRKGTGRARTERFSREVFISVATDWLRFTNRLRQEPRCEKPEPEAELLKDFVACLDSERGLSQSTITGYLWYTRNFLRWCERDKLSLEEIRPEHLDLYFVERGAGGWSRVSNVKSANALRAFFRQAGRRQRCQALIEQSIQGPPIYRLEALPDAPHWSEVIRLTDRLNTNRQLDIRDRAIIMLCATYGLRLSELRQLRLDHIDWEEKVLRYADQSFGGAKNIL